MKHPHRLHVTIAKKKYISTVFDIAPRPLKNWEVKNILGQDFTAWVQRNGFGNDAAWDVKCVPEEVINYECA